MLLRRFEQHPKIGKPFVLDAQHPAVVEGRSRYTRFAGNASARVLVSGFNSKKIGLRCTKSRWKGMPLFTLTLEERKTCPRTCKLWQACYGNKMHWSRRNEHGPDLEDRIELELAAYQEKWPNGFVVRLHILGDFYSVGYVRKWADWLNRFSALHVFGYTARQTSDPIGQELQKLIQAHWKRFAVRSSERELAGVPYSFVVAKKEDAKDAVVCPAQTGATDCCGTCGLCWQTTKPIAFVEH